MQHHRQCGRLAQPGADLAPHASRRRPRRHDPRNGPRPVRDRAHGAGREYVTGDYSRGASGFWVENGRIAYPVQEITIAGNMKSMLKDIEAIGADTYNYGAKTVILARS
jgi:hypothetical protein